MDCGAFCLELTSLQLSLQGAAGAVEETLSVKLDVEILNHQGIFKWGVHGAEPSVKYSSDNYTAYLKAEDNSSQAKIVDGESTEEKPIPPANYILGFNNTFFKSSYIDLNEEVLTALANASVSMKILLVNSDANAAAAAAASTTAAAPAKGGKGAPAPVATPQTPTDECIMEIVVPLKDLFLAKGNMIEQNSLDKYTTVHKSTIIAENSTYAWKLHCDNDIAEYIMGCSLIQFDNAVLVNPPVAWSVHYTDVIDPKAKVPPTAAELRAKYLENIKRIISSQSTYVKYDLTLGSNEGETGLIPVMKLPEGTLVFNEELANTVSVEEDIRIRNDLWSLTFNGSPLTFYHRNTVRKLVNQMKNTGTVTPVPVQLVKSPSAEGAASEGSEISCSGQVDISPLFAAGVTDVKLSISNVTGGDMDMTEDTSNNYTFTINMISSSPLIKVDLDTASLTTSSSKPSDLASPSQVSLLSGNKDVLKEFRDEIAGVIRQIAQEYLVLYPFASGANAGLNDVGSNSQNSDSLSVVERKAEFMHYLSTSGTYHAFKERLKPKIQRLVRDKYGARGQALGKDGVKDKDNVSVDKLLGELYVFLVKECNVVLNEIYTNTMLERDVNDIEQTSHIDDEVESPTQILQRLLLQAFDAEADGRVVIAEQLHLERIQLLDHNAGVGSKPINTYDCYSQYAYYLLRVAASMKRQVCSLSYSQGNALDDDAITTSIETLETGIKQHLNKAREAFELAAGAKSDEWRDKLLLVSLLVEIDQVEVAEGAMLQAINIQLKGNKSGTIDSIESLNGYETDKLVPVDPLCYAVLASIYSIQKKTLACRKALRLIDRCWQDGTYEPHYSTHGVPRRSIVLSLTNAALYLFAHGTVVLGNECIAMAVSTETACAAKAQARGLPTISPPFIRHLLKRSQAVAASLIYDSNSSSVNIIDKANESIMAAKDPIDIINGNLCLAVAYTQSSPMGATNNLNNKYIIEAYLNSMKLANEINSNGSIPLEAFIAASKLLINSSRYAEAFGILMIAGKVYKSATIFLLIGIACIRLERFEDAEDALLEANLLDNRNPEVWCYIAVLCLALGSHRLVESEKALYQGLRLNVNNASLLRELATLYISYDKLVVAEDLVRRSLVLETKSNGRARKLLADILASQNEKAKAIDEYSFVINDNDTDVATKVNAAEKCILLLMALGRKSEANQLAQILQTLNQQQKDFDSIVQE